MEKLKTYYQEKENIYIYSGNKENYYRINVNTGEMFGQTGRKLTKSIQIQNILTRRYYHLECTPLPLAIAIGACELSSNCAPEETHIKDLSNSLTTLYSIAGAMSARICRCYARTLMTYAPYAKIYKLIWDQTHNDLNKWLQIMDSFIIGDSKFEFPLDNIITLIPEEYFEKFFLFLRNLPLAHYSKEELDVILYYGIKQKIFSSILYNTGFSRNISKYLSYCRDINKKPIKTASFTREFAETHQAWSILRLKIDNKKIADNYARRAKFWDFSYGDFIIKIPTCGEDLVEEGRQMHHCVGGYVNSIAEGRKYICFIRHKDNPDKPYITCEIDPYTGRIRQYFLAYDRFISSDEDIEFKKAYQEYLSNCHKEYKTKEL